MNDELAAAVQALLDFYKDTLRPYLQRQRSEDITNLDFGSSALGQLVRKDMNLSVGFVGESQVGKSTLINALLGYTALPSGGVGPLTAQATHVKYAEENALHAVYHPKRKLNQLAFTIQNYLVRRGELSFPSENVEAESVDEALGELDAFGFESADEAADGKKNEEKSEAAEYMLSQAQTMLSPSETRSSVTLLAGLRQLMGHEFNPENAVFDTLDEDHLHEVRTKIGQQENLVARDYEDEWDFQEALKFRAAGPLAPLIASLQLELDVDWLKYATLVDLPGIGVVGDPAGKVAEEFVRKGGDLLVVVMRNNGLAESVAGLLERTGVITKLLFAGKKKAASIRIL
ncbi:MAG: dynamin family protein, partial [Planctomycetota bacterium]|nr:dynamin family protein [Planctomycetota bacterium]